MVKHIMHCNAYNGYVLGTQMNMWRMQGLIRYIPPPLASSVLAAQTRV